MTRWAHALALLAAAGALGCKPRRQPIAVVKDAGPLVEVFDPALQKLPKEPLVDEREPDDDTAHAQPLTLGSGIRGTMAPPHAIKAGKNKTAGDEDVYSWLQPGAPSAVVDGGVAGFDYARVELTGVPGLDLALEVLDGDGKRLWLANDGAAGEGEVAPNVAVEAGHTYYLRVHEVGAPKGDAQHPYELTMQTWHAGAGDEREPNDDFARATDLTLGGSSTDVTGFYGKRHDEDWLRINVAGLAADKGATLRLELSPVDGVAPQLRLVSNDKQPLGEARASRGEELRLRNVGVDAGGLVVGLRAMEGRSTEIRWTLRVGVEPSDPIGAGGVEREPNNDPAHATPLQLTNGTAQVSGYLWPGDSDVYRVVGANPESLLTFEVEGVDKVDLKLERIGSDGKMLVRADDATVGQGEILPPWRAGDGYVRVAARARDSAFDVPYRLTATVSEAAPDEEREPNDTPATATAWPAAVAAMRGRLAPRGDEDWFAVEGTGTAATVRVDGSVPALVRIVDEARHTLPPGAPLDAGKKYFVVVKAASEKAANARDVYTVTLAR